MITPKEFAQALDLEVILPEQQRSRCSPESRAMPYR